MISGSARFWLRRAYDFGPSWQARPFYALPISDTAGRCPRERGGGFTLRRVVILGGAGTGKSTLARELGRRLSLPVVHLDTLYWQPGWQVRDTASFRECTAAAIAGDMWISEGNYRETFDLRLPRADIVIILEAPRWLRLVRALRRPFFQSKRVGLPDGCPDRFDWGFLKFIWRFDKATWPRIEATRAAYGHDVPVIRLRSNRAIADFLASLGSAATQPSTTNAVMV